jgi:hypothetical protein
VFTSSGNNSAGGASGGEEDLKKRSGNRGISSSCVRKQRGSSPLILLASSFSSSASCYTAAAAAATAATAELNTTTRGIGSASLPRRAGRPTDDGHQPVVSHEELLQEEENTATEMASDEDYMSFLERANQDLSAGGAAKTQTATARGRVELKAVDDGVEVPAVLIKATESGDSFYVSDADEPFEPVCLEGASSTLPDEGLFMSVFFLPKFPPFPSFSSQAADRCRLWAAVNV